MQDQQKHKTGEVKLERKLSPLNVWALALGCIVGASAFLMPAQSLLMRGGTLGTAIAFGIAACIMIVIALNYQYMINKYPVSGGEFIYSRNAFGHVHGFVCAWFLGLAYFLIVPLNATALSVVGGNLLPGVFKFGFHYAVAGYDIYLGEILLAIAALVILAWVSIRGVKIALSVQTVLTFLLVGGIVLVVIAAFVRTDISWSNLRPLFSPGETKAAGVLGVVAIAPWAFVGFDTVPQSAEEFKFSPKKSRTIMILSIILGALIYIALNTLTAACVPAEYANWAEYIQDLGNVTGLMSVPTFYAAHMLLGNVGVAILGIAAVTAALSGIVGFYMATSRLFYALSQNHALPAWFGRLSERNKTPRNAILVVLLVSCIAPFFGRTALGWIVDMSSVGAAIGYGYTSAATLYFAVKDGDGGPGIKITGVLGVIFAVLFAILLLVPIKMFDCSLGRESWICLIVWIVLGIIFYFTSRSKHRKEQ